MSFKSLYTSALACVLAAVMSGSALAAPPSDESIDKLLTFYQSPSGQALINKMPTVMQKSLVLSQQMMESVMPKLMANMKAAVEEAKAAK